MAKKPQNLLLVTEHYPCSSQESFLETELPFLTKFFNVYIVTRDTDQQMHRILPEGVVFTRPAERSGKLHRLWLRLLMRMSHAYRVERRQGHEEGRWNHQAASHTLNALVESELMRRYVLSLPLMQDERPLVIYSANFNDYLYGLVRIKEMGKDIHVAARCHRANMFDPRSGERRETLNYSINEKIDAVYFTSEERRSVYVHHFTNGDSLGKYRVAPMGVPGPEVLLDPPEEDYQLRIVTCSPIEEDKRLSLLIDAMADMRTGQLEWVHIGDGSQRDAVVRQARRKLENKPGVKYEFVGDMNLEERYHYYATHKLDVFLSVSSSESVPSRMLEAMANHIFVCATAVDGVTDVVSNETGLLMPENPTLSQLTAFLEMLCSMDKEKFNARAEMGYQCWEKWFNADENCLRFASELSAVENIRPDEETLPVHRTFKGWKPEERVEVRQEVPAAELADKEPVNEKIEKHTESSVQPVDGDTSEKNPKQEAENVSVQPQENLEAELPETEGEKQGASEKQKEDIKVSEEDHEEEPSQENSSEETSPDENESEKMPADKTADEAAAELFEMMDKMGE